MEDIKAIETFYNGYRFRSRLEARWAVFFDSAGIVYEYEPEGFKLSDGTYYLPDFYLPWFKCYVEIKRAEMTEEGRREAERRCRQLFEDAQDKITMLCIGDPVDWNVTVFCNDVGDSSAGSSKWEAEFIEGAWINDREQGIEYSNGRHYISLALGNVNYRWDKYFCTSNWKPVARCVVPRWEITSMRSDLADAKLRARQARFEFGEKG